jgi:diguanylate cyclase (GGDEF)-like protein/PAS domain S-box-containing protein
VTPDEVSRALFHHAPAGLFAMSTDGIIRSANDTFCEWAGHPRDDIVGRYVLSLLSRGSRLIFETRFMPLLRTQRVLNEMMLTLAAGSGSGRDVLVSSVLDDSGPETLVYAAVFDAGIRIKYERDLLDARRLAETAVARVRILQEAAAGLAPATTMAAFGSALRLSAETATDASTVSVIVAGAEGLELVSGGRPLANTVELADLLPVQECLDTGLPVLCRGPADIAASFPGLAAALDAEGVEAVCVIPVIEDGTENGAVGGVIACWFQRSRDLDENLLDVLAALAALAAPVLERIHLQRQLEHQSLHDSLTGLPNRLSLQRRLRLMLSEAELPDGQSVGVLFLDLDGFKAINDDFGHEAGDQVLQQVAGRLLGILRAGDLASRFGGDEFVLACAGVDRDTVLAVAGRIRLAVEEPLVGLARGATVSASIGIGLFLPGTADRLTPDALIALADEAMLSSKRAGKNRDTLVTA